MKFKNCFEKLHEFWKQLNFNGVGWRGGTVSIGVVAVVFIAVFSAGMFGAGGFWRWLIGFISFAALSVLLGLLLTTVIKAVSRVPVSAMVIFLAMLPAIAFMVLIGLSISIGIITLIVVMAILAGFCGASFWLLRSRHSLKLKPSFQIAISAVFGVTCFLLMGFFFFILKDGFRPYQEDEMAFEGRVYPSGGLTNPSAPGPYAVSYLTYGSGTDRHREAYSSGVSLRTPSVDGTGWVEDWNRLRENYWGFGLSELPLNGKVWYPEAAGSFPLVMIVHGQHMMEQESDSGYAYLGELLASRGFIVVSIDENFINMSPLLDLLILNSINGEVDLRAKLLLDHLSIWQGWNDTPENPFFNRINLDQIALIGHSRGGEAVAVAAALNQLGHHPDDGNLKFDYGYNIQSIVSIAPVDGQFLPRQQHISLQDINYLTLQGAQDMDVFTYFGQKQFERVQFTQASDHFKAGIYIRGANHGQFNTDWGRKDLFEPIMRFFDLSQLMLMEEQTQISSVFISAFLEATLHESDEYEEIFQDFRTAQHWLPNTNYLTQYQSADQLIVADYEEDLDLTSTQFSQNQIQGEYFTIWNEQPLQAKYQTFEDEAVHLGWDQSRLAGIPTYSVTLPTDEINVNNVSAIVFSIAQVPQNPVPGQKWSSKEMVPVDCTLKLLDQAGNKAQILLSDIRLLPQPIEGHLGKLDFMTPFSQSEVVMQYYQIPMAAFLENNPAIRQDKLTMLQFVFDQTQTGYVAIDDIGLMP